MTGAGFGWWRTALAALPAVQAGFTRLDTSDLSFSGGATDTGCPFVRDSACWEPAGAATVSAAEAGSSKPSGRPPGREPRTPPLA